MLAPLMIRGSDRSRRVFRTAAYIVLATPTLQLFPVTWATGGISDPRPGRMTLDAVSGPIPPAGKAEGVASDVITSEATP
ncbi:hypothetical protein GCM10025331_45790 [Actinoplanes utahensis]|nr:hypothetical protein Aut01nite_30480 [Actinoplanes utahensis]